MTPGRAAPRPPAYVARAREAKIKRMVEGEGSGLLTVERVKEMFVRGEMTVQKMEQSLVRAIRRELRREETDGATDQQQRRRGGRPPRRSS